MVPEFTEFQEDCSLVQVTGEVWECLAELCLNRGVFQPEKGVDLFFQAKCRDHCVVGILICQFGLERERPRIIRFPVKGELQIIQNIIMARINKRFVWQFVELARECVI